MAKFETFDPAELTQQKALRGHHRNQSPRG